MIKRTMWVALIMAVGMMFASNASKGDAKPEDDPSTLSTQEKKEMGITPKTVKVAAAPANPFNPYVGVNVEAAAVSDDGSADDWASDDPSANYEEPKDTSEYTALLTTAQDAAAAYGTYSYERTPDEYVASIPSLDAAYKTELSVSASRNWPQLKQMQVIAQSQLVGTSPDIVYYQDASGIAQISVTVAQTVTSVRGESTKTRSYVLDLKRSTDGSEKWLVTGVAS